MMGQARLHAMSHPAEGQPPATVGGGGSAGGGGALLPPPALQGGTR
jgi:hypothetical protein